MPSSRARQRRTVRPTALIFCEGAEDLIFVRHIKKLYASQSASRTNFTVTKGNGGAQDKLVNEALKVPGDFSRRLLKMDRDRPEDERLKAEQKAARGNILIAWSLPCLEAMLLAILDSQNYSRYLSKTCKRKFESDHIPEDKRTDSSAYDRIFSKEILDEARLRLPELDDLISFFLA